MSAPAPTFDWPLLLASLDAAERSGAIVDLDGNVVRLAAAHCEAPWGGHLQAHAEQLRHVLALRRVALANGVPRGVPVDHAIHALAAGQDVELADPGTGRPLFTCCPRQVALDCRAHGEVAA